LLVLFLKGQCVEFNDFLDVLKIKYVHSFSMLMCFRLFTILSFWYFIIKPLFYLLMFFWNLVLTNFENFYKKLGSNFIETNYTFF
jgi:hypothetical protein